MVDAAMIHVHSSMSVEVGTPATSQAVENDISRMFVPGADERLAHSKPPLEHVSIF